MIKRILLALLVVCTVVLAQTGAGHLQGTVTDASGALIPSADVVVTQTATGVATRTQSNTAGQYSFPSLQPGPYTMRVEAAGFEGWAGTLVLQTGQQATVDVAMKVGAQATQVTVSGDVTPLVTTSAPSLSNVLERERIEQLPINGRAFQTLMLQTTPGLEGGAGRPKAFGLRDGVMEFLQDGVPVNDANVGSLIGRPPGLDTIQEFRVETNVSSARFSRPTSTIVSTRSGSNQFHGSMFYTGRNNGFGVARRKQDYYDKPPQLIRNEYGASLGGPVELPKLYSGKNRTFFFFAWESLSLRSSATHNTSVPTAAMRQGDFSRLQDAAGRALVLYDPWSTQSEANNWRRQPFPGNVIPVRLRSPFAARVFDATPLPTNDANPIVTSNWFGPDPTLQDGITRTTRIDHRFGDKDTIYGRYTWSDDSNANRRSSGGPTMITLDKMWNYQTNATTNHNAMLAWNHVFSPSFFMETVATGTRIYWRYSLEVPGTDQDTLKQMKLPNPFGNTGAPQIMDIGLGMRYDGPVPRSQDTKPISLEQNFTNVRGKHSLEFGWRWRKQMLDVKPDQPQPAVTRFASLATSLYDPATGSAYGATPRTGYDTANFFLGVASVYNQTRSPGWFNLRSTEATGYFQDNWRMTSRLTLNLGLRYDYISPVLDTNGVNSVFDYKTKSIVRQASIDELYKSGYTIPQVVNPLLAIGVKFSTAKELGYPSDLVKVSQLNFSPRVGFAYNRKFAGRDFVLRGGYGAYRFPLPARTFNSQRNNPPLQGTFANNINSAAQSPDGRQNWGIRSVPGVIAGLNSENAIDVNAPNAVARGVGLQTLYPDLPASVAHEWNLTLEGEIFRNTRLRVGYVGTAARNLDQSEIMNQQPNNYVWFLTTGQTLPTGEYAPVVRRSFDQTTYGDITIYRRSGYSNYNGLQVELQRRFDRGLAFQWFYVMSNALSTGSTGEIVATTVPDVATFLPGTVPTDYDARNRFLNYSRDPDVPKHRVRWNLLYDLPVGRGKRFLGKANGLVDRVVGGWQIAASGNMSSRYWQLPTNNYGSFGDVEVYGTKYKVDDCRSGVCIPGYLYYNGYIPANRINSVDAQGRPNGVMGVPSNYKPSSLPIWPTPANGGSAADPNFAQYETNNVLITLKNGSQQRVGVDPGTHPWQNQYAPGPWTFNTNASLFKVIPVTEKVRLRLNVDFFNVLNNPGLVLPASNTGILSLQNSNNEARQLQASLRLTW